MADSELVTIAIVDDDESFSGAVMRELDAARFCAHRAASTSAAVELLKKHRIDIMLTDLRMGDLDGIDLLKLTRIISPSTRTVLMSAYATAKDYRKAMELGAVEVLSKPFTPDELHAAISKAVDCDRGFRGDMHGLALTDILQMFNYSKKSVTIRFGPEDSAIYMRDGDVVHAVHGQLTGCEALTALLACPSGIIKTGALEPSPQTIDRPLQSVLLDSLRELDERRRRGEDPAGPEEFGDNAPTPVARTHDERQSGRSHVTPRPAAALVPQPQPSAPRDSAAPGELTSDAAPSPQMFPQGEEQTGALPASARRRSWLPVLGLALVLLLPVAFTVVAVATRSDHRRRGPRVYRPPLSASMRTSTGPHPTAQKLDALLLSSRPPMTAREVPAAAQAPDDSTAPARPRASTRWRRRHSPVRPPPAAGPSTVAAPEPERPPRPSIRVVEDKPAIGGVDETPTSRRRTE